MLACQRQVIAPFDEEVPLTQSYVGSRRNGGMRRFRNHAITLTAPSSDAGGRGSDLAGCTPGLGWKDSRSTA